MAMDVGVLTMRFKSDDQKMLKSLDKIGKSLNKVGMVGATALVAIGGASLKTAADFEKGMSKVQAITDSTDEEMKKLEESAKQLGATTAFSAKEAAEGMSFLGMAGFETNEIIEAMPGLLDLAAASGTDLALTADIVSDALSAFKLEAKDTAMFSDVLAKAASSANVSVQTLGESFKFAAPIAGAMGFSVQDVTAALGAMGNKGIKASQAGTALRTAMTKMATAAEETDSLFTELGVNLVNTDGTMREFSDIIVELQGAFSTMTEAQKASTAETLFGKNAMTGMLAVLDDANGEYLKLKDSLDQADGSAKKMANTMLDNLSGQMTLIKSATEGVAIEIGQILIPVFMEFTQFIQSNMPAIKKVLVATFEAITAGGKMVWDFFNNNLLPIFQTLFDWVNSNSGTISAMFKTAFDAIGVAINTVSGFVNDKLLPIFNKLNDWVVENMPAIQSVFETVINAIVEVGTTLYAFFQESILPILQEVFNWVSENMPLIQEVFGVTFEFILSVVSKVWKLFKENLLPILQTYLGWVKEFIPVIGSIIAKAFNIIISVVKLASEAFAFLIDVVNKMWEFFKPVFGAIGGVVKKGLDLVVGSVNVVISTFQNLIGWVERAIEAVKRFFGEKEKGSLSVPTSGGMSRSGDRTPVIRGNRANGGMVTGGDSFIVGEKGPEVFTPSTSGMISPNKSSNVIININGTTDVDEIMNRVVFALNQQGIATR